MPEKEHAAEWAAGQALEGAELDSKVQAEVSVARLAELAERPVTVAAEAGAFDRLVAARISRPAAVRPNPLAPVPLQADVVREDPSGQRVHHGVVHAASDILNAAVFAIGIQAVRKQDDIDRVVRINPQRCSRKAGVAEGARRHPRAA
jgi:hypothetical protein